jgi:PIN domain nuclease of toxin-antitoxin system
VIIIDTHIWIWWVHGDPALPSSAHALLVASEQSGIGVNAISCWEVAKLVERQRLTLPCPVLEWIRQALSYPGIRLLELSPEISVESTQLPGTFHRDPADQIIVATARIFDAPLLTVDTQILAYPHVRLAQISA